MSFNRGMKRDSFGNRNFNSRPIGGVGMNPWEGGMMPGRGILPTPNNNLSLASPQAQLAIASNLLSNLLRSHQETQPQVPSLLSLGNAFGGPGPNFRNQQNFLPGRFNDRQMRRPVDNRRSEPYNKMGNRARDGPAGRRGPSAQQSRAAQSGNQRINGNQNQHRNDKSSKPIPASKQNQAAKKEQQDVKTSDNEKAETPVVKSDEVEESEEKKRDWKDEKKEGEATQIVKTETEASKDQQGVQSEAVAGTAEGTKEGETSVSENEPKTSGKKSEARHAESRYADVPMNKMVCHVCNKHMWDGSSFENHLRGRAHLLMMDKLDESYKLKVDLMRHELRVAEEQRELSLSNSKRRGKKLSIDLNVREYCTMCDLNFYGTLSTHRKSEKHQQLKTFLHPRCFACMKEFPSRIEYDEHCLTPLHMKSTVQSEEQRKNKKKDKLAKGESDVRNAEDEEKESAATELKGDKDEDLPENAEYLTDIVENVVDPKYKIPSFKHCRQNQLPIGKSMVKEVQGYYCEKCRRFMLTSDDMTVHLRSITHYRSFVQEVKNLISSAEAKPTEETEETEKDISKDNEEYEGNWKRRKIAHSEDEDANESKEIQEPSDGVADVDKKVTEGDDKYDPMEADVESEEEGHNDEEENQLLEGSENLHDEEKKTTDEKMWADIDNDNDLEIGNLLDEIADEKEATDVEESPKKVDAKVEVVESKAARGRGTPRARGNRARRSRR